MRLSKFNFPLNLNETTRAYFERTAQFESGQTAADMRAVLSGQAGSGRAVVCPALRQSGL